jgi:AbrB family looped-hinge helix DNA binding protein
MIGGNMVEEAVIDKKGRIVIPAHLRQGLGLREGAKVKLALEEGKILIMRQVTPRRIHSRNGRLHQRGFPNP